MWAYPDLMTGGSHIRPPWLGALQALARCTVTAEAIMLLLYTIMPGDPRRVWRWRCSTSFGLGLGLLAFFGGATPLDQVRVGCFSSMVCIIGLWAFRYYKVLNFAIVHATLLTVWLGTAAFASVLHSIRGDWLDAAAMVIQDACLFVWTLYYLRVQSKPVASGVAA